jgi:hypothetical protein
MGAAKLYGSLSPRSFGSLVAGSAPLPILFQPSRVTTSPRFPWSALHLSPLDFLIKLCALLRPRAIQFDLHKVKNPPREPRPHCDGAVVGYRISALACAQADELPLFPNYFRLEEVRWSSTASITRFEATQRRCRTRARQSRHCPAVKVELCPENQPRQDRS